MSRDREAGLVKAIEDLIRDVGTHYSWAIPDICPISYEKTGNTLTDTLNLRAACHLLWLTEPERRQEICGWYVRRWGKIAKTSDDRIAHYVETLARGALPDRLMGVASWSKVASICDPNKYPIYDARVAFALNALLIRDNIALAPFRMPGSQSTTINAALKRLKAHGIKESNVNTPVDDYRRYMALMHRFGTRISLAEMALFGSAPMLAAGLPAPSAAPRLARS
ncbi:MAG TPA: hypothetical protein VN723_08255 [Rhizomicrobium sp.]|nr:hypothetical protein [Rhizomicrobium sp.]